MLLHEAKEESNLGRSEAAHGNPTRLLNQIQSSVTPQHDTTHMQSWHSRKAVVAGHKRGRGAAQWRSIGFHTFDEIAYELNRQVNSSFRPRRIRKCFVNRIRGLAAGTFQEAQQPAGPHTYYTKSPLPHARHGG